MVPEVYRQSFQTWEKSHKQMHVEFVRKLVTYFSPLCIALKVETYDALCDLVILEQFKNSAPSHIAIYINDHVVKTAAEAAALAEDFILTHRGGCEYQAWDNVDYRKMAVRFVQQVNGRKELVLTWVSQNGLYGVRYSLTPPKYVTSAKAGGIGKLSKQVKLYLYSTHS